MKKNIKVIALASAALGLATAAGGAAPALARTTTPPPLTIEVSATGLFQENFNPLTPTPLPGTFGLIYEPLFYFNTVGPQVYKLLGTKYEWSKDSKVLTVQLRKGVKWSDGQPFTADDVVFTFNQKRQWPATDGFGFWQRVKSVSKVNDYEVQFVFNRANVPFAWYILGQTPILPAHIWSKVDGDPTKITNENPVGTGPYLVKSFSPQAYYYKANPKYWGGKPKVEEVAVPSFTGGDSSNLAFAAGKIDWGGGFIPNIQKLYISGDPKHRHYWFPPEAPVLLYTNNNDPLLGQLAVRKAISLAINRDQLANVAEYGYEQVASPTGLLLPNQKAWLDPKLPKADRSFTYDPNQAEQILQKAGFRKGSDGIYVSPQGKRLSFTLNVVQGWTDWDEMANMIALDLKKVGIEAQVQQLQFGAWAQAERQSTFQLSIGGGLDGPSPYYFYNALMSPNSRTNYEKWYSGASKLALDKYTYNSDPKVQKQAIYQLQRIMAEQLPSIPLVNGATWYEYDTTHYTGWPTAKNPYAQPAPYDYPAIEIVLTHLKPVK
ncbi:MAG: ABC transporter substrate-binding protein [Alicyclobacillus sp.]|nr:ABC transporter substrate-binding protein [Alicyclobacillus sp.]